MCWFVDDEDEVEKRRYDQVMRGGTLKRASGDMEGASKKKRSEVNSSKNFLFSHEHGDSSSEAEDDGATTEEEKDMWKFSKILSNWNIFYFS